MLQDQKTRAAVVVLMHGDKQIDRKALATQLGFKKMSMADPKVATQHTGFQVGGTSPLGLLTPLPIYYEATMLDLPRIWFNGGQRGFIISMDPKHVLTLLPHAKPVSVAVTAE